MVIPLQVEGGFQTDLNGKGIDTRIITTGNYSAVWASCQCNGSGQWVMGATGYPQYFQSGANVVMGPVLLRPGEQVQVEVVGANSGAEAAINYWGWQGGNPADPSDLAPFFSAPLTAGSLSGSVALTLDGGTVGISGNVPVQNASGSQLAMQQAQSSGGTWPIPPNSSNIQQDFPVPVDASGLPTAGGLAIAVDSTGADTDYLSLLQVYADLPSGDFETLIDTTNVGGATILYTVVPAFSDSITMFASAPSTNGADIDIVLQWLPPGIVNVSEIINTPGSPVYVNLAQPSSAWSARNEPGSGSVGPTVVHTPPANQSSYVTYATGGLLQTGTTAFVSFCRLSGTINGVNENVWEGPLGVQGVLGDSAQCPPFSGGAIKFDPGTTVTLGLSGTIATGVIGMLSMLGYDQ